MFLFFSLKRYFTQISKWDTVYVWHIHSIVSLLYNWSGWIDSLSFLNFVDKSQSASTSGFSLCSIFSFEIGQQCLCMSHETEALV